MMYLKDVRDFWNDNPCGAKLSRLQDQKDYFREHTEERYKLEWHIPNIAQFDRYKEKDVLEIGCGIGADGLEFARHGARYTGVDLSFNSIKMALERFRLNDIPGRFLVVNAEELPFENESFDHIYSFGVIHHSPSPEAIVKEIYRVLRPGATLCVMLYNRISINYYIEIMFLRKILKYLLLPTFMPGLLARMTGFEYEKLVKHRKIMIESSRMSPEKWISINTDGPDCPIARVYNLKEGLKLFQAFDDMRSEVWFFNKTHWPLIGALLPQSMIRFLGKKWGWHRIIYATKRNSVEQKEPAF